MAINVVNLKKMPAGKHRGVVINSEVVDTVFDRARGPESTFALTIQPKNPEVGVFKPLTVNFTPEINPLSAMGALLERMEVPIDYSGQSQFNEKSLIGAEVEFTVSYDGQFPRIAKDSIVAAQ